MTFKIRQDLTLQKILKHPGLFSRLLQGHQVLNLTEGHHPLGPLVWSSILEASGWVFWIHEELQIDPLRVDRIKAIHLVHHLHFGNKRNWRRGGEG
jgi:hypothetical protein